MRINYNATAMLAVNALNKNDENLAVSTGKLSSGYKINRAKDNPSGYAMSRRMRAQLEGLLQAKDNSDTGVSILKAVDGALSEVNDMLQRMNELAIKGANGTLSNGDRELIDEEMQKLKEEIQRTSETFEFNGQKLLDGSFQLMGYSKNNVNVKVAEYDGQIESGDYIFDLGIFNNKDLYDIKGNLVEEAFITPDKVMNVQVVPGDPSKLMTLAPNFSASFTGSVKVGSTDVKVQVDSSDPSKLIAPSGTVFPAGFTGKMKVDSTEVEVRVDPNDSKKLIALGPDFSKDFTGTVKVLDDTGKEVSVKVQADPSDPYKLKAVPPNTFPTIGKKEATVHASEVEVREDPDNPGEAAASGTVFPDGFTGTKKVPNMSGTPITLTKPNGDPMTLNISDVNGTLVTLENHSGFQITLDIRQGFAGSKNTADPTDSGKVKIELTGLGAMTIQVGSNEGQELDVEIPNVGIKSLGINLANTRTKADSLEAVDKVSAAIGRVSSIRSKLGAYQNRLEAIVTSNEINHENMTSAYSNIIDTDMAEEYTKYATYQVLSQASTSVLAQANERPSQVLQLLQ